MLARMMNFTSRLLRIEEFDRLSKFLIVGLSNTAASFSIFWLILYVTDIAILAQCVGYGAGVVWSYFWNRRWTFSGRSGNRGEFRRFVSLQVFLWILSSLAIGLFSDIWNMNAILVWIVVMVVVTLLNYAGSSILVFRVNVGK